MTAARRFDGSFAPPNQGIHGANFGLRAYGHGIGDGRRVTASSLGIETCDPPDCSNLEDAGETQVPVESLVLANRAFGRGRLARAGENLKFGVKGDADNPISVMPHPSQKGKYVVIPGKGDHRAVHLKLAGKKGNVPVKMMKPKMTKSFGWIDLLKAGTSEGASLAWETRRRDVPKGKWREEGGSVVAFHGTLANQMKGILKEGLRFRGQPRSFEGGTLYEGARGKAIFVINNKSQALWYARQRAFARGRGTPVVLRLRLPKEEFKKFKNDGEHQGVGAAFTNRAINPKWIVGAQVHDGFEFSNYPLKKTNLQEAWVVFFLSDEDLEKSGTSEGAFLAWESRRRSSPTDSRQILDSQSEPIRDLDTAIRLLGEGKGIMLEKPEHAVTLLNKLGEIAADAKAKGTKAPSYDLCKVSVKGSNLFCHDSMKVPRDQMPQLTGVPKPGSPADKLARDTRGRVNVNDAFIKELESRGIKVESVDLPATRLRASQNQLDGSIVAGLMQSEREGKLLPQRVFVSKEGYIVDGHHRWAAKVGLSLEKGPKSEVKLETYRVDMPILDLLKESNSFADSFGLPKRTHGERGPAKKSGWINLLAKYGTSEGAIRAWDVRGRSSSSQTPSSGSSSSDEVLTRPSSDYTPAREGTSKLQSPDGLDTLTQHTTPDGKLTPERQVLHNAIVDKILGQHKRQDEPVFQILGGGAAVGKSTVRDSGLIGLSKDRVTVDVDQVSEMLPEFKEEVARSASSRERANVQLGFYTHEEASLISKRIIDEAKSLGYNVLLDGAGDGGIEKLQKNIERYRAAGHKIEANYVTSDYDKAYAGMRERGDQKGRYIPAAYMREVHSEVSKVVPEAIKRGLFDSFAVWDTTEVKFGSGGTPDRAPKKIASGKGKELVIHDQKAWDAFLLKGKGIPPRSGEI